MISRRVVKSTCDALYSTRKLSVSAALNATKFTTSLNIFDRETKRKQKEFTCSLPNYKDYEYVKEEVGYRVADRVFDIKRSLDSIVDLGCQRGYVSKHLTKVSISHLLNHHRNKLNTSRSLSLFEGNR